MSEISVPALSLVVLVGISGSGKSSFVAKHFAATEVLSSDFCRALVGNDENDQSATEDAFDVLHYIARTRLRRGLLTVVDATNVQREARHALIHTAREQDVLVDAIILDVPERVAVERNSRRPDRVFGKHVLARQHRDLRRTIGTIEREGFRRVHVLRGVEAIDAATVVRERAWTDKRELTGPFDIIGDVHGCRSELVALLRQLGWNVDTGTHPDGRTAVFVGDLVDRGPDTPGVLRLVMSMVAAGTALCVAGNHEEKLVRALSGRKVKIGNGLQQSLDQLADQSPEFTAAATKFMRGLISHYELDGGNLVVAHAGLKEAYHGRASSRVRSFALYGDTTGETDEFGLPVRLPWANDYRGRAMVVYGHTPVAETEWVNNTICLDTGAVFGGKLTALRYPSREIVSVPAEQEWYAPTKPLAAPTPARPDTALAIGDVTGTRYVDVRFGKEHGEKIKVREENSAAALEVMSRFAIDPRWLLYLPPTMAPCATSSREGYLEYPDKAFAEYAAAGVTDVVCEEKHMGSRAIVILTRAGSGGFGEGSGVVYTRTGRAFFDEPDALIDDLRRACEPLFDDLATPWLALDCELLPWTAKADTLVRDQFASVAAAAEAALPDAVAVLEQAAARGVAVESALRHTTTRLQNARRFRAAYRRYAGPADVRLAPFQILAYEGAAPAITADHAWHLDKLALLRDPLIAQTRSIRVDLTSDAAREQATSWWLELTGDGGEGMVVKPLGIDAATAVARRIQPGLKVRGREYLRIIYGADYLSSLDVLRNRSLGRKRSQALREHALGLEALARLTDGEPLWRIHEAVFAVLALESEPVDPRL